MRFKSLITLLSVIILFHIDANSNNLEAYKIEVSVPFAKGDTAYFARYWKGDTYVADSTIVSKDGIALFKGDQPLSTGQYLIYIKPNTQIELLIDQNQKDIKINLNKDLSKSTISGSDDTQLYWLYIKEFNKLNKKCQEYLSEIKKAEPKSKIYLKAKAKYIQSVKEIDKYTAEQISKYRETWFCDFIKASQINIHGPNIVPEDKEQYEENKLFVREHYFDNVDFTDTRLWNTSFFVSKIDTYLTEIVPQDIDSISHRTSWIVRKSIESDEAFELLLSHLFNEAITSTQMWKENVWTKLAEDYIFDKNISWIDSTQYSQLKASYSLVELNRIGMKAQNLRLATIDGDSIDTNNVDANYTLLYFYSPSCSHCEHEIPILRNELFTKYKNQGMKVIAFNTERDETGWKRFVEKHNLNVDNWINVSDPQFKSQYWLKYNVEGTPSLYLLDKNKTIIAKKLNMSNLEKFMDILIQ